MVGGLFSAHRRGVVWLGYMMVGGLSSPPPMLWCSSGCLALSEWSIYLVHMSHRTCRGREGVVEGSLNLLLTDALARIVSIKELLSDAG